MLRKRNIQAEETEDKIIGNRDTVHERRLSGRVITGSHTSPDRNMGIKVIPRPGNTPL
ncbi:hypothetical protein A2U01_0082530 [Trifolium medium]|uniref:Uncharacterized protein n=1 Tax=Trifolium medium TaxID=97028 RepID=A0A392TJG5_9FABA|nr:hypothetical protein [Trifolium medium]